MMEKDKVITRYGSIGRYDEGPRENGDWCRWTDVESLIKDTENLRASFFHAQDEIANLRNQVEKLTELANTLARQLTGVLKK